MKPLPVPSVFLEPEPAQWSGLIRLREVPSAAAKQFRTQFGLLSHAPLIMTGHQATLWHPGILAKYFAAEGAAGAIGAEVAWVVADQDERDFGALDVPTRDASGALHRLTLRLAPSPPANAAAASCPAFNPIHPALPRSGTSPASVQLGLASIVEHLNRHRGEASAGRQVAGAVADLVAELIPRRTHVFATDLSKTHLMRDLVEQMRREPLAMAAAYNEAVAAYTEARVAPLQVDDNRVELPLWRLRSGSARSRIWSDDGGLSDLSDLAPRALLMTAILRLAGCELFIHGRGGGAYDLITDRWIGAWLGASLAPTVIVSADLTLPLDDLGASAKQVAAAKWRVHRAAHDPAIVNDTVAAAEKQELVVQIADARRSGNDPRHLYVEMHRRLDRYRAQHAASLSALSDAADAMQSSLANAAIATDRTWAFPLHERSSLLQLRDRILSAFGVTAPDQPGKATAAVNHPS